MTDYGISDRGLGYTKELAGYLASLRFEELPEPVVHQCRRGLVDWLGCALAGSRHPTVDVLMNVLAKVSQGRSVSVIGRDTKFGLFEGVLANGQMGHVLDYDDTHMDGVFLHTSSPVLSGLLALAEMRGLNGKDFCVGYVSGFEAGVRVGQASPRHHDGGWHLTGTLGSIAAGAACSSFLSLNAEQMVHALGLSATQAGGMQQNRGTMSKSFHAGKAGQNGVFSALLAEGGFDSSNEIFEGKKGFCRIFSKSTNEKKLTDGLGKKFFISTNGYKAHACGVVLHPTIDTAIGLKSKSGFSADEVDRILISGNSKASMITGVENPKTGLKSKFSISHAVAVAFIDGVAGIAQFSDQRANERELIELRKKVQFNSDDSLSVDQAKGTVISKNGRSVSFETLHATGTVKNPLSDASIKTKFLTNAEMVTGVRRAEDILDLAWNIEMLGDLRELTERL